MAFPEAAPIEDELFWRQERILRGISACIFPVKTGATGGAVGAESHMTLAVRVPLTHLEEAGSIIGIETGRQ